MSDKDQIAARLGELTNFIAECTDKVEGGEMVDLKGLDDEIASLCERTVGLPPEDAQAVQPAMADMIARLEKLGVALKNYKDGQAG